MSFKVFHFLFFFFSVMTTAPFIESSRKMPKCSLINIGLEKLSENGWILETLNPVDKWIPEYGLLPPTLPGTQLGGAGLKNC